MIVHPNHKLKNILWKYIILFIISNIYILYKIPLESVLKDNGGDSGVKCWVRCVAVSYDRHLKKISIYKV